MSSSASQSSPKFRQVQKPKTKLDFTSSIWDDDHTMSLDEKTDNAYGVL